MSRIYITRAPLTLAPKPCLKYSRTTTNRAKSSSTDNAPSTSSWDHIMAVVIDNNQHLSSASRSTLDAAAILAAQKKLTVMIIDEQGKPIDAEIVKLLQQNLQDRGIAEVNIIEETIETSSSKGAVAVGEAADTVQADLVVLSTTAVHEKHIDANLLAEFVPSAVLFIP